MEFFNKLFQNFLNKNNIKHYSRKSPFGAVFAETFNRTTRDLLKRPIFEKGDGICIVVLPAKTKQFNNKILSWIMLTPIQASSKKSEGYVYKNVLDKRKKIKPKVQGNDPVRTTYLKETFSKSALTSWS